MSDAAPFDARVFDGTGVNNAIASAVAPKARLDANFHGDNFDHARS